VTTWEADGVTMEHLPDAFNWHDGRLFVRVGAKKYKNVSHGARETNLDGLFGLLACAPAASIDAYLRSHGYEVSPVVSEPQCVTPNPPPTRGLHLIDRMPVVATFRCEGPCGCHEAFYQDGQHGGRCISLRDDGTCSAAERLIVVDGESGRVPRQPWSTWATDCTEAQLRGLDLNMTHDGHHHECHGHRHGGCCGGMTSTFLDPHHAHFTGSSGLRGRLDGMVLHLLVDGREYTVQSGQTVNERPDGGHLVADMLPADFVPLTARVFFGAVNSLAAPPEGKQRVVALCGDGNGREPNPSDWAW
jgi:hypothetical protein